MVGECKKFGMRPVCDHPRYCKNDAAALYLGQSEHLAYKPHRNNNGLVPSGLSSIRAHWEGLCSYTGTANGSQALCNIPTNQHNWYTPAYAQVGFMCGRVARHTVRLGALNGVPAREYAFSVTSLANVSKLAKYPGKMIAACAKLGMKPVCDHPSYCKNDPASLYIGQSSHLAYNPGTKWS